MNFEKKLLKVLQYGAMLIMLTPLFYNVNFIFPYVFLKNIIFRALVIILAVVLSVYWHESRKRLGKGNPIFYGLIFFLAVMSVATFLGLDIYNSFWGGWERMDGLLNLLFLGVYFVILINTFKTKAEWSWLFRASILTGLLVCFYGLFKNGLNISTNTWTTLGNSAFLGYYLLLNLFAASILLKIDTDKRWRIFYIFAFLAMLIFMLGAASRAPIISFLLSAGFMGLVSLGQMRKRAKIIFLSTIVLVIFLGGLIIINKDSKLVAKINFINRLAQISGEDPTTNNRLLVWQSGWEAFKDRPILGYGPENIPIGVNKHYNPLTTEQWFDRTHNFVLDYLLFGGIFGLAGYLVFIISGIYCSWQIRKKDYFLGNILASSIIGCLLTLLFIFDTLNSWIIIMVILAFASWAGDGNRGELDKGGRGRNIALGLIVVVGTLGTILFYVTIIKPVQVNLMAGDAYRYSQVDPQRSVAYYDRIFATRTFGMREICMHLIQYATIAFNAPEANAETKKLVFEKAEEKSLDYLKSNDNLQVRVGLAQLYLLYGQNNPFYYGEAIKILENNIDDSPRRMEIYFIIASAYNEKGETARAIEYLERAYQMGRGVKSVYLNLLRLYDKNGQRDKISAVIEEYLSQSKNLTAEDYRVIAEYYFKIDKVEEAKKILLEHAIPADRDNWRSYISYASIYEYEGKIDAAISYLQGILSEHSDFQDVFGEYIDYLKSIKK